MRTHFRKKHFAAMSTAMITVTLISSPTHPALSPELPNMISARWSGSAARWLAKGEAAEFDLQALPANFWQIWNDLQTCDIDMVAQPSANRRKKILLADMDSTMIDQECIDELAAEAGVGPRVAEITARAMNGELDFEAALDARVALLKNLPETVIAQVLATRITLAAGAKTLMATLRAQGIYTVLVSGGFTRFTAPIAGQLGFDENHANTLLGENGKLTGAVARPILGRQAKVDRLHEVTARLKLTPADVIAVGDGANDLGMLALAGTGVALHAKPTVAAQCDVRINHGDLTALLYLQGIPKSDFVIG
jgi:phosphoserine phosphatase